MVIQSLRECGWNLPEIGTTGRLRGRFWLQMSSILIVGVAEHQNSVDNDVFPTSGTECIMTSYCIALVSPDRAESRLRMGEFPAAERAFELAELIAFDLSIEVDGNWWGWTVEVRSAQGRKLFAVPVTGADVPRLPGAVSGSPAMAMGSSRH
jgi:hypothetical protein